MAEKDKARELRGLLESYNTAIYHAVQAGKTENLPAQAKAFAKAIQDHLHLTHIHNALEFAELREGEEYVAEGASPMAHLAMHAVLEGQLTQDEDVKAAFAKLLSVRIERHHAAHVLGLLFLEFYFEMCKALEDDREPDAAFARYRRNLKRICTDAAFRRKYIRKTGAGHPWPAIDES